MDVAKLVGAVLDAATLEFGDSLCNIGRDGAGLWVWHQAPGAEHTTQAADLAHQVWGRDHKIEVHETTRDLFEQVVGANNVGTGFAGGGGCLTIGKHCDTNRLAGTCRQRHGATDDLIGLSWIDAQTHGKFN